MRHRLHRTKETTQPNNKAPRRTLFFGSFVFFVMTVPAERPHCRDTHSIHTPHYCGQFHIVAAACKVSSHRSQRKITQHSLEHQNPSKTSEKMGYFDRVTVSLDIL